MDMDDETPPAREILAAGFLLGLGFLLAIFIVSLLIDAVVWVVG